MPKLDSAIDRRSPGFRANAEAMRALIDDLRQQTERVAEGGGARSRERHVSRGKLLPRDRVQMLLDPGTPFLELSPLAAHGMYHGAAPCAGLIAGIGRVEGVVRDVQHQRLPHQPRAAKAAAGKALRGTTTGERHSLSDREWWAWSTWSRR